MPDVSNFCTEGSHSFICKVSIEQLLYDRDWGYRDRQDMLGSYSLGLVFQWAQIIQSERCTESYMCYKNEMEKGNSDCDGSRGQLFQIKK